jgi:Tol biopolymer transport system component
MELKTKEGHVLGTAPYMSPEQAQGKEVDHRSDIFSFGSVLYEMVTGRRAFAAQSLPELLTAIIREKPSRVSEIVPSVPLDLEKLIARALRKEPERRWQSFPDMRVELQEIKEELESGGFVSVEHVSMVAAKRHRKMWLWLVTPVVMIAFVVAGWLYFSSPTQPPPSTIPLTAYPGWEYDPALSPDGNQVAFTRLGESGVRVLFVKMVDGGEPLLVSQSMQDVYWPTWSPDGRQIAFVRRVEDQNGTIADGVFVVSAIGGGERQLGTFRSLEGLSWSVDEKLLALADMETPELSRSIYVFSFETGEKQRVTVPPAQHNDFYPRFSPDGETLAFGRVRQMGTTADIYLVPTGGGEETRLTFNTTNLSGFDWTPDGRNIVFSAFLPGRGGEFALWRISASGGEPEPLEMGENAQYPSISRHSFRLAYMKTVDTLDIWRVGGPTADDEDKSQRQWISSTSYDWSPEYSPDGQKIAFSSARTGDLEIWISDSDGSNPHQLTFLEQTSFASSWSPDGRYVAFHSSIEGDYEVYRVSAAGGIPQRLTTETGDDIAPTWSSDGRWIYFSSMRTGERELYKMPAEGGDAVQITTDGGTRAFETRDGQAIYFAKSADSMGSPGIWRIPVDGGEEVQVLEHARSPMWALFENGICYLSRRADSGTGVDCYDFAAGGIIQIATLEKSIPPIDISVSPDGRWILYNVYEGQSDIMLVENFR